MTRPTIADLAREARVSVSTINRILSGTAPVKPSTMQRVQAAAERIGFYGIGAIKDRLRSNTPHFRFGFLLQQSEREIYQMFGKEIVQACRNRHDEFIDPCVEFVDILTPENIASELTLLGESCDAVAVIAQDHPLVGHAIHDLSVRGVPVVTYITDQSSPERAAYVGADNWKLGRTAAWLIAQMTHSSGRVAVFLGNHRYQCQDVADASLRSYMRENAPHLVVEESIPTHEESDVAYKVVKNLLTKSEDLVGILIVGGGVKGILQALREVPESQRNSIRVICRDIGSETRKGLSEGLITAALCHPLEAISNTLVQTMIDVIQQKDNSATLQRTVPFDIVTPENV